MDAFWRALFHPSSLNKVWSNESIASKNMGDIWNDRVALVFIWPFHSLSIEQLLMNSDHYEMPKSLCVGEDRSYIDVIERSNSTPYKRLDQR